MAELLTSAASDPVDAQSGDGAQAAAAPPAEEPKWFRWRADGKRLIEYLLDSEVHTYAFSVAANAILSFIPFCVLLYTLAYRVFNSTAMAHVIDEMVNYFLPSFTHEPDWLAKNIAAYAIRSSAGGVQVFSLVMILIACTGIFLPLEVALNQAWGVTKSRNYLWNQTVAFGLAILMVILGMASILLNLGEQEIFSVVFFGHTDNVVFNSISYVWMALSTGVASILFFFSIYWVLPNRKVPWRPVLKTSVITGLIWLASKLIFVAILPHMHLEDLYGPFYVTVGLLFWAYVSGLILFAGAQFSVSRMRIAEK